MYYPALDPIHCRNIHILCSQIEAYGASRATLFDADENKLYRVGRIKEIWLEFLNILTRGKTFVELDKRVVRVIDTTVQATTGHLDRIKEIYEREDSSLRDKETNLKALNEAIHIASLHSLFHRPMFDLYKKLSQNKLGDPYNLDTSMYKSIKDRLNRDLLFKVQLEEES